MDTKTLITGPFKLTMEVLLPETCSCCTSENSERGQIEVGVKSKTVRQDILTKPCLHTEQTYRVTIQHVLLLDSPV